MTNFKIEKGCTLSIEIDYSIFKQAFWQTKFEKKYIFLGKRASLWVSHNYNPNSQVYWFEFFIRRMQPFSSSESKTHKHKYICMYIFELLSIIAKYFLWKFLVTNALF